MTAINKDLYDALIEAKVSDAKATAAAIPDTSTKEDTAEIKTRLSSLETHLSVVETRLSVVETRLSLVEKLQWGILLGVVSLIIKAFVS